MNVRMVLVDNGDDRRIERHTKDLLRIPVRGEYLFTEDGRYVVIAVKWNLDRLLGGPEVTIECEGIR